MNTQFLDTKWGTCIGSLAYGTILLIVLTSEFFNSAWAVQAHPEPFEVSQPDGTVIVLQIVGDEHAHWHEDLDGFTVVQNQGRYFYAERGANGRLNASLHAVGAVDPVSAGLERGVLPSQAVLVSMRKTSSSSSSSTSQNSEQVNSPGSLKNLVVMIRFADHTGRPLPTNSDLNVLFNATGGDPVLAPTGSVRDVYLENSYGLLTIDSTVYGWIDVPGTEAYYADGESGSSRLWDALKYALDQIDQTLDFGTFDNDNNGYVDGIAFIHSGYGAEWGGTDSYGAGTNDRIWSHKWAIQPSWVSQEGVRVYDYHISPGVWGTAGSDIGRIGVICHETGHFLGLPDLYDIDLPSGSGIGSWGMMANSWGFDGTQLHPPHFSAWSKIELGWVDPTVISSSGDYAVPEVEFNQAIYKIESNFPSNEYLLIENRQPVGVESVIPGGGGLAIWHIDDNAGFNTQGYPGQFNWPENGNHYRVALLQADGYYDLERNVNRGDAGDVYKNGAVSEIGPNTVPNTDAYQDGNVYETGHVITAISNSGPTMQFTLTVPAALPSVASSDYQTVYGQVVSGNYTSTHNQNDIYEIIDERDSGGKPSRRHDRLQHIWAFSLTNGDSIFHADAFRVDGGDADTGFIFEWSTNPSGPWTQMFTVTTTSDNDVYQDYDLGNVSGTVYVQARDDNRSQGQRSHDALYVDHMYFDPGTPPTDLPAAASSPSPQNGGTNVSIGATLSWTTGSGSTESDVYFGTNPSPGGAEFQGTQSGSTFDPGTLSPNTTYFWRVDETNIIGTTTGSVWSFNTGDVATTLHVEAVSLGTASAGRGRKYGRAVVVIRDAQGAPVLNASVTGTFTGTYNETVVATTDSSGTATLQTIGTGKKKIAYDFCVGDVQHGSLNYDSDDNVVTCSAY